MGDCKGFLLAVVLSGVGILGLAAERPSVVLILSDDQGAIDLGCFGSKDLHTPNLDALAARGVRFTQFYAAAPYCSPSRAALMTGRYPQRAGVPGNVGCHPGAKGMPPEQVTIAEVLRAAGYRTGIVGKWHLGTVPECSPNAQGFDDFFGMKGGCFDNWSHTFYWDVPPTYRGVYHFHDLYRGDEEVFDSGRHFTSMIVREAVRFLDENKDRPFFLYLPFNIPHYPLQSSDEATAIYRDKEMTLQRRQYAAWVTTMDLALGQVLKKLDDLKLRGKTLVVFFSDNGHSTEARANYGGGSAGPLRGSKGTLWEGGIRVPCIAAWPGRIPDGEVRPQLAAGTDWFPTLCELCNVPVPGHTIDGKSLVPILASSAAPTPHQVFHWQMGSQWAVRKGDWKLVSAPPGRNEKPEIVLSNLAADATETASVDREHPEVVRQLTQLHEQWLKDVASR